MLWLLKLSLLHIAYMHKGFHVPSCSACAGIDDTKESKIYQDETVVIHLISSKTYLDNQGRSLPSKKPGR